MTFLDTMAVLLQDQKMLRRTGTEQMNVNGRADRASKLHCSFLIYCSALFTRDEVAKCCSFQSHWQQHAGVVL